VPQEAVPLVGAFDSHFSIKERAMREHISDVITQRAADGITRRGSLMTLGAAGLAAIVGGSATADAKKNKKKNKKKKQEDPFKLCAPQVEQCQTTVTALEGNAAQIQCCDAFATCEASQFFLCLIATPA
jgi:hypothetical protein